MLGFCFATSLSVHSQYNNADWEVSAALTAGHEKKSTKQGYYLVAGVFSDLNNLKRFNSELSANGYAPDYFYIMEKNKYYSYIYYSDSFDKTELKCKEVNKSHKLKDAWVLRIDEDGAKEIEANAMSGSDNSRETVSDVNDDAIRNSSRSFQYGHRSRPRDLSITHNTYPVYVNVHNGNHQEMPTVIKVINGEDAQMLTTLKSHEQAIINCPKSEKQRVQLVCEVFGFHKTTFDLNLEDPITPSTMYNVKLDGQKILVDMPLEKYRKGDIMVMYNVYFHPNTNVMRVISNYELQRLLEMLQENPALRIKIHGHTNGKSFGEITKVGEDCDDFFNPKNLDGVKGSSKKLSLLRASVIKQYLIKHGIENDRIETKGWGARRMLYKENSPQYKNNVRVEVEILEG